MYDSTLKMHGYLLMSYMTWLDVREKPFQTKCFIMLPVCVEQSGTGFDSEVISLLW